MNGKGMQRNKERTYVLIECICLSLEKGSVAEVQFSPVLPPFFENREPN